MWFNNTLLFIFRHLPLQKLHLNAACTMYLQLMSPIFESPKSVSLMWPVAVMRRLKEKKMLKITHLPKLMQLNFISRVTSLWHLLIRFEITVNYSIAVKVFQSKHRLSKIHPLNKIQSIKHYLFNKYNFNLYLWNYMYVSIVVHIQQL